MRRGGRAKTPCNAFNDNCRSSAVPQWTNLHLPSKTAILTSYTSTSSTSGYYPDSNSCNKHWRTHQKAPNSLWLSTRAPFGFAPCYWKYLCFPVSRSSGHPIGLWPASGILSAVLMPARCTKWYFSTSAWQQENKEAQDEFFGRPLFELLIM